MRKIFYSIAILTSFAGISCSDDYVKTDQKDDFSDEKIESLVRFPESALNFSSSVESGGYGIMRKYNLSNVGSHEDFAQKSVDIAMDAMGQDMVFGAQAWFVFHYTYQMRTENMRGTKMYYYYYAKLAHNANLIIQSLVKSNPDYRTSKVYGRALAIRAFANMNLMRVLANGDLGISYEYVDYNDNAKLKINYERVATNEVNKFIEKDFIDAYNLLDGFSNASNKGMIDQKVVSGMISRFYLQNANMLEAKKYALLALGGKLTAVNFTELNDGFSNIHNPDVMWGSDIDGSSSTVWASFFSHMDTFNNGYGAFDDVPKRVDARLYAQINEKDKRKGWFYNGKDTLISPSRGVKLTPSNTAKLANLKFMDPSGFQGDYVYMRKSEMLLNYAEAAFESGDESASRAALEVLMETRQKGYSASTLSGIALQKEIRLHRRVELWGEGFGLPDIIRWGEGLDRTSSIVVNGITVESTHGLVPGTKIDFPKGSDKLRFQFPIDEINANQKLRPQNP